MLRRTATDTLVLSAALVVFTWPWALHLGDATPAGSEAATLTEFHLYLTEWTRQVLTRGGDYWDAPFFAPLRGTMAWSEPQPLLGLLCAALFPVLGTVGAYNFWLAGWLLATGLVTAAFARHLGAGRGEAIAAGAWMAAGPYTAQQVGAPHLVAFFAPFLALYGVFRFLAAPAPRWVWLTALAAIATGLTGSMNLLFLGVLAPVPGVVWAFVERRGLVDRLRAARPARLAAHVGVGLAAVAGVLVPVLGPQWQRLQTAGMTRRIEDVLGYVRPADLITPAQGHWLGTGLLQWDMAHGAYSWYLGFGWLGVLGASVLLGRKGAAPAEAQPTEPARTARLALAVTTGFALLVAFGPSARLELAGATVMPYEWLRAWVPGMAGVRSPAHIFAFVAMGVAVGGAVAATRLLRSRPAPQALGALVLAAEAWGLPAALAPVDTPSADALAVEAWLREAAPAGPVLELPMSGGDTSGDYMPDVRAMRRALRTGHPVTNGYSGFFPLPYQQLQAAVTTDFPGRGVEAIRALGVGVVWAHRVSLTRGGGGALVAAWGPPAFSAGDEYAWRVPELPPSALGLPDPVKLRAAPAHPAWLGLRLTQPPATTTLLSLDPPRSLRVHVDGPGAGWDSSLELRGAILVPAGATRVGAWLDELPTPDRPGRATLAELPAEAAGP